MSNSVNITTNTDELIKQFSQFSMKEMRKTNRRALAAGASKLATATKRNLRLSLPKSVVNTSNKYSDTLIKGVRYRVDKNAEFAKIHIMGKRSKGSGTFRLRFFEKGTKLRINKKTKGSYGKIKPLNFFALARNSSQTVVQKAMQEKIIKTIQKINATK